MVCSLHVGHVITDKLISSTCGSCAAETGKIPRTVGLALIAGSVRCYVGLVTCDGEIALIAGSVCCSVGLVD